MVITTASPGTALTPSGRKSESDIGTSKALGLSGLLLREAVARALGYVFVVRPRECMPGCPMYFWRDQDGFASGPVSFVDEVRECLSPFERDIRYLPALANALQLRNVWFSPYPDGIRNIGVKYMCGDPARFICRTIYANDWDGPDGLPTAMCRILAYADEIYEGYEYAGEVPRLTGRQRLPEKGDTFRIRHTPYVREVIDVRKSATILRTRRSHFDPRFLHCVTGEDGPPIPWDQYSIESLEYESRADGGPVTGMEE